MFRHGIILWLNIMRHAPITKALERLERSLRQLSDTQVRLQTSLSKALPGGIENIEALEVHLTSWTAQRNHPGSKDLTPPL